MATHFKQCAIVGVILSTLAMVHAEDKKVGRDNETLRYYLSKSSLVVSGEIIDDPLAVGFGLGERQYSFSLKVGKVLQGHMPLDVIRVGLTRSQGVNDRSPSYLKKGERVILFLEEKENPQGLALWKEADHWFGVQEYNSIMELVLERLAKEE